MKNTFTMSILIAGAIIMTATSCLKEENIKPINTNTVNWKSNVSEHVNGFVNSTNSNAQANKKNWAKILGADCTGCAMGGILGACTGSAAGALIGGLGGAAIASYVSWLRVGQPPFNPSPDSVITNNPFDYIGRKHNLICLEGANNPVYTLDSNNLIDSNFENVLNKHLNDIGTNSYLTFNDYNKISASIQNNNASISDKDLEFIFNEFMRGMNYCEDKQSILNYIYEFENMVIELPIEDQTKNIMLMTLSVASHSTNLWIK